MKRLFPFILAFILISSCSDDKDDVKPQFELNQTELSINYDKDYQFEIKQGSEEIDPELFTWSSSNEFAGEIDNEGYFKANKIGTTTITATGEGATLTCEVTVDPYSNLYKEPVLNFGGSKSTIKGGEQRILIDDYEGGLSYEGENENIRGVLYGFESDNMVSAIVLLDEPESVITEAGVFLEERYTYLGVQENYFMLSDIENNIMIALNYDDEFGFEWNVIYLKGEEDSSSGKSENNIQIIKKALEKFEKGRD